MAPKKKSSQVTEIESSVDINGSMATSSPTLQEFFDQKMKQQSDYINDLFIKYTKVTKSDLDEVKKSQNFLNDKFENLLKSVKELKTTANCSDLKILDYKDMSRLWKPKPP